MMKEEPLVSILMCTYNSERFIHDTLNNLLEQDYQNFEILVFDDCSCDDTFRILKEFEKEHEKIKVFYDKKLGPYGGLNYLLKFANGKYIAIQDHDDLWYLKKLSKQVTFLERNNKFVGCGTSVYYYFEKEKMFYPKVGSGIKRHVTHTTLMFRNIKGLEYDVNNTLPDEHFEKIVLGKHGKLYRFEEIMAIRRMVSSNTNLSMNRVKINIKSLKDVYELNKDNPMYIIDLLTRPFRSKWLNNILRKRHDKITYRDFLEDNSCMRKYV